jgi:hypothetical protein
MESNIIEVFTHKNKWLKVKFASLRLQCLAAIPLVSRDSQGQILINFVLYYPGG